ncbi:MAG: hypothetical protein WDO24_04070 [Pseudomonadota bacterium]
MSPLTYFLAFARLAPCSAYPGAIRTRPASAILDYFLTCDAMEPEGAEAHYTELLVRLPGPTLYYQPPRFDARLKTRVELGLDEAAHLYICPQSLFKFHPDFDAVLVDIPAWRSGGSAGPRARRGSPYRRVADRAPDPRCADIAARIVMMRRSNAPTSSRCWRPAT